MDEMVRTIESYEDEVKELKHCIAKLQSDLQNAKAEIRAGNTELNAQANEIIRLQGMVEAFEICVKARR